VPLAVPPSTEQPGGGYGPLDGSAMKFIDGSSIETTAKLVNDFRKYRRARGRVDVAEAMIYHDVWI
jgi:hypothetical protein